MHVTLVTAMDKTFKWFEIEKRFMTTFVDLTKTKKRKNSFEAEWFVSEISKKIPKGKIKYSCENVSGSFPFPRKFADFSRSSLDASIVG